MPAYREFKLGGENGIFEHIVQGKRLKKDNHISGDIPFVMSGVTNTGLVAHIGNPLNLFPANSITVDIFGNAFYRNYEFSASDDVGVYWSDKKISKEAMLFICTVIGKRLTGVFDYNKKLRSSQSLDITISLPVTASGNLNFEYMEKYIRKLKAVRIRNLNATRMRELKTYLNVAGLSNYRLTPEDCQIMKKEVVYKEFKIVKLFTVKNTHSILSNEIVEDSGTTPYLTASALNNSVGTYISYDSKLLDKGDCIFIGGKTFVVSYQEQDFFSNDSHNLALYLIDANKKTKENQLFMAAAIYKSLSPNYSWGDSISKKKIQNDSVMLPVDSEGNPDYDFMTRYVESQKKLAINNVVEQKAKEIATYKKLVYKMVTQKRRFRCQNTQVCHKLEAN